MKEEGKKGVKDGGRKTGGREEGRKMAADGCGYYALLQPEGWQSEVQVLLVDLFIEEKFIL